MSGAIVVLSGGQDSTTCLYWAKSIFQGLPIHALTFNYGQLHEAEIEAAQLIAFRAGVTSHEICDVGPILKGSSPLVDHSQELEQYEDHSSLPGGLEKTFVPARNALFLTLAANRAYVHDVDNIVTGVCQEDFGGYPDCRQIFIQAMQGALHLAHDKQMVIHTPLMHLTKAATVALAMRLPGCYEALAYTHTAYDGKYPPTGHDHANLLRQKGFEENGTPDPLVVRAHLEGLMELPDSDNYNIVRELEFSDLASFCSLMGAA